MVNPVDSIKRFGENALTLATRLKGLGYHLGDLPEKPGYWYEPVFCSASRQEREDAVRQIEARVGPLPLDLRAFYLELGGVSLLGFHPEWPEPQELDPFSIAPLAGDWVGHHLNNLDEWAYEMRQDGVPAFIELAPDALHKGNISGGPPYTVSFPQDSEHQTILDLGGERLTLIEYLRRSCKWGGFPGLKATPDLAERLPLAQLCQGLLEI